VFSTTRLEIESSQPAPEVRASSLCHCAGYKLGCELEMSVETPGFATLLF